MKRKAFKRERRRVREYAAAWLRRFPLDHYVVTFCFYDDTTEFMQTGASSDHTALNVSSDWRYLRADINVNTPITRTLNDAELEAALVHELLHIVVDEMGCTDKAHEERAVTTLQKVVMRARYAGYQQRRAEHEKE